MEMVLVPAILVIVGFGILRWLDGQWWGVLLWILASPVVYLLLDVLFFSRRRAGDGLDARRRRHVVTGRRESAASVVRPSPSPPPEWKSARERSTGGEILERGRRYDQRRRA